MRKLLVILSFFMVFVVHSQPNRWLLSKHASAPAGYTTEAQRFFDSVALTDVLTTPYKDSINGWVVKTKVDGTWDSIKVAYPYKWLPATATARAWNLKNPATYKATFVGSPTQNANGVHFNESNQYVNSGFVPHGNLYEGSAHLGFACPESAAQVTSGTDMGSDNLRIIIRRPDNSAYSLFPNSTSVDFHGYTSTDAAAVWYGVVQTNTVSLYRGGSSLTSTGDYDIGESQFPTDPIFVGGYNGGGSLSETTNHTCSFATIGAGLSGSQVTTATNATTNPL